MTLIFFASPIREQYIKSAAKDAFLKAGYTLSSKEEAAENRMPPPAKPDYFRNILKPEETSPNFELWKRIYNEIVFLNYLGSRPDMTYSDDYQDVAKVKAKINEYYAAIKSGKDRDSALKDTFIDEYWSWKACPGCLREGFGKDWQSLGITPKTSDLCASLLKDARYLSAPDAATYEKDGVIYEFKTSYQGSGGYAYPELKTLKGDKETEERVLFPKWWHGVVGFFEMGGKLYHVDSDTGKTKYDIFEFVPENLYFKEVCSIRGKVKGARVMSSKSLELCQKVADGKYKTHEQKYLLDILDDDTRKIFKNALCRIASRRAGKPDDKNRASVQEAALRTCLSGEDGRHDNLSYETHAGKEGLMYCPPIVKQRLGESRKLFRPA